MEPRHSKRKSDKNSDSDQNKNKKRRRSRSRTPKENRYENYREKRKYSKSPSVIKRDKRRTNTSKERESIEKKSEPLVRKSKQTDMLNTKTGGAYIPPARLRMMQAQITDKSSVPYQRLAWEALKKSIHGHINKINVGNIGIIIKELLKENIVRGRGLLCRSVIQAQAASPTFTNVYAALASAVNSRFPNIGELLLKRLVIQFKRGFKRNDKPICISSVSFIAHLVNQKVAHEILALELLTLLVETPTDDSVEVAIAFLKECGHKLTEVSAKGINAIFEMLRNILHEGQLDKRVQYMIEVMFQVWKDGFKDHPAVIEELELVPEEEQFTHLLMLDDATDSQDILNVFKFDEKYEENEQKYKSLCNEILGSEAESGEEDGSEGSGSEESDDDEEGEKKEMTIIDKTETNLVALRRTIYLTINSSLDFEECAHKLMKMQLKPGQEIELCHMFLDCCAEQRTYEKFYGLLAQRFCNINRIFIGPFEEIFKDSYATAHRLDTNRLRNVSKFFAHLLFTDSISWEVIECVKLNEEDTTSSSRIYIKILFQELAEYMGLKKLNERLKDPTLQTAFAGVFPRDNPRNTRFSINFFTSIGLGGLTDELREHLKQMPKNVPAPITEINIDSDTSSDSSSSSSSSSSDSSDSSSDGSENEKRKTEKTKNKKKKTAKAKTPDSEPPIEKETITSERWGHDGFYNTYGRHAKQAAPKRSDGERQDVREYNKERSNTNYSNSREIESIGRRNETRETYWNRRDDSYSENTTRREKGHNGYKIGGKTDANERRLKLENDEIRIERSHDNVRSRREIEDERNNRRENENQKRSRRENADERRSRRENEDEIRSRRDNEDDKRSRRENEDDKRSRRENEDEKRSRRENEDDKRSRRENEDDSRSRRENEDDRRSRREYEDDRRSRRENDDDKRSRRENEDEKISRRENEDDKRSRRENKDDKRSRRENKDDSRSRRENEDDRRSRHENEDEKISRRENEDEKRSRRENKDDKRFRREDEDEIQSRRENEDDKRFRREDEDEIQSRRENEDDKRSRRDNEDDRRHRRETEEHKRRRIGDDGDRKQRRYSADKIIRKTEDKCSKKHNEDERRGKKEEDDLGRLRKDKLDKTLRKDDDADRTPKIDRDNEKIRDDKERKNEYTTRRINENKNNSERSPKQTPSKEKYSKITGDSTRNDRDEKNRISNKKSNLSNKIDPDRKKTKLQNKIKLRDTDSYSSSDSSSDSSSSDSSSSDSSSSDSSSSNSNTDNSKHKQTFKKPSKEYKKKDNNLGGRYWDNFEIDSGRGTEEEKEKF